MTFQQQMCANCGKPLSPYWRDKCQHCKAPIAVARGYGQMAPQYGGYAPQMPVPPQYPPPYAGQPAPQYPPQYAPQPAPQYMPQPAPQPQGQRPPRVQSVLRGPDQASCLQQAVVDGERATANSYRPVWQSWGQENGQVTLTILYDLAQAPAPAVSQPTSTWSPTLAPTATPTAQPAPTSTAQPAPPMMPPLPISVPTAQAPMPATMTPPITAPIPPSIPPPVQQPAPPTQQGWSQAGAPAPPMQAPMTSYPPPQSWAGSQPTPQAPQQMPSLSQAPTPTSISSRVVGGIVSVIVIVIVWLIYAWLNRIL